MFIDFPVPSDIGLTANDGQPAWCPLPGVGQAKRVGAIVPVRFGPPQCGLVPTLWADPTLLAAQAVPGLRSGDVGSVISGLTTEALVEVSVDDETSIRAEGVLDYVLRVGWSTVAVNQPFAWAPDLAGSGSVPLHAAIPVARVIPERKAREDGHNASQDSPRTNPIKASGLTAELRPPGAGQEKPASADDTVGTPLA